jgi:hypothetical protein
VTVTVPPVLPVGTEHDPVAVMVAVSVSELSVAVTVKVSFIDAVFGAPTKVTDRCLVTSGVIAIAPTANIRTAATIAVFNKLRMRVECLHCIESSPCGLA